MEQMMLSVQKKYACDVLVVGGGPAGVTAAIAAAREGADVLLLEQGGFCGGMATRGLVGPFMTSYDADGKKQLIVGFFDEFVRKMEKEGGAVHPFQGRVGYLLHRLSHNGTQKLNRF